MTFEDQRWDRLFADLSGVWAAESAAEQQAEVTDRTRHEIGKLRLVDRLRPAVDSPIVLRVRGSNRLRGKLLDVGPDWALLAEEGGARVLVALQSLLGVSGLSALSAEPGSEGEVGARLDLRYVLRGMVRDRAPVSVASTEGDVLAGTFDRVGADFVELAEHSLSEQRRRDAVRAMHTLPIAAIALVRSR